MSDPHGIALIGFGTAGRIFHAPLIEATPELALRYVSRRHPSCEQHRIAR